MSEQPNYFNAADMAGLVRDFPIGPDFLRRFESISRDELRALQEDRFAVQMKRAWGIPFYQRLWGAEGLEPRDIRGLEDIVKLPTFDKSDIWPPSSCVRRSATFTAWIPMARRRARR